MRAVTSGSCPASRSSAQSAAVRRSCQTMARPSGRPVARSQTSVVSRWLVMPIAARSAGRMPGPLDGAPAGGGDASTRCRRGRARPSPSAGSAGGTPPAPTATMARFCVEDDGAARGRALVDGEDMGHARSFLSAALPAARGSGGPLPRGLSSAALHARPPGARPAHSAEPSRRFHSAGALSRDDRG